MGKPVILTDCDGVLLQWLAHTPNFVEDLGYDSSHLVDAMRGNQFIPFFDVFCASNEIEALERLQMYHESEYMKSLPVIEDQSVDVINRLKDEVDFIVITSFSDKKVSHQYREENLKLRYGDSFSDLICLKPNEDKTAVIKDFVRNRDVILWLDDQIKHVHHGINAGARSFQYTFGMDCGRNTGEVPEIGSWAEVEDFVLKSELQPSTQRKKLRF